MTLTCFGFQFSTSWLTETTSWPWHWPLVRWSAAINNWQVAEKGKLCAWEACLSEVDLHFQCTVGSALVVESWNHLFLIFLLCSCRFLDLFLAHPAPSQGPQASLWWGHPVPPRFMVHDAHHHWLEVWDWQLAIIKSWLLMERRPNPTQEACMTSLMPRSIPDTCTYYFSFSFKWQLVFCKHCHSSFLGWLLWWLQSMLGHSPSRPTGSSQWGAVCLQLCLHACSFCLQLAIANLLRWIFAFSRPLQAAMLFMFRSQLWHGLWPLLCGKL